MVIRNDLVKLLLQYIISGTNSKVLRIFTTFDILKYILRENIRLSSLLLFQTSRYLLVMGGKVVHVDT